MNSLRKWLYKPKKTDKTLLAQFYFADEELNTVAAELDSFDSRKDPERCQALVTQLRSCQDKVLTIIQRMMDEAIPYLRTTRDFRVKFPDDVVQENLAGQLWFGAECLAAGSSIMNREMESASMRPLARALTKNLDSLRCILRDQCLMNANEYSDRIREALIIFDKLFAEFELSYVSAMVPVKSVKDYETIQEITVLFSETVLRAKQLGYITTDMIDEYDPALMFTIPRLAIICGLLIYADGPLNPDSHSWNMSDMFRPFQTLLYKIRELLYTLSESELLTLERALCSQDEPEFLSTSENTPSSTTTTTGVQTDAFSFPSKELSDDALSVDSSSGTDGSTASEEEGECHSAAGGSLTGLESGVIEVCDLPGILSESVSCGAICCHSETGSGSKSEVEAGSRPKCLNKCDSNDSGLHSDGVSNSDSQYTISSSDSHQLFSHSALSSPILSPSAESLPEDCTQVDHDTHYQLCQSSMPEGTSQIMNAAAEQLSVDGMNSAFELSLSGSPTNTEMSAASDVSLTSSDTIVGSYEVTTILSSHQARAGPSETLCAAGTLEVEEEEESFYSASPGESPLHLPQRSNQQAVAQSEMEKPLSRTSSNSNLCNPGPHPFCGCHNQVEENRKCSVCEQYTKEGSRVKRECDAGDRDVQCSDRADSVSVQDDTSNTVSDANQDTRQSRPRLGADSDSGRQSGRSSLHDLYGVLHAVHVVFTSSQSHTSDSASGNDNTSHTTRSTVQTSDTTNSHVPVQPSSSCDMKQCDNECNMKQCDNECNDQNNDVDAAQKANCGEPDKIGIQATADAVQTSSFSHVACLPAERQETGEGDGVGTLSEAHEDLAAECSQGQCDRCTQTPHSVISNARSSKIHHHHHHRQHSNPPSIVPPSASVSSNTSCADPQSSCNSCDNVPSTNAAKHRPHQQSPPKTLQSQSSTKKADSNTKTNKHPDSSASVPKVSKNKAKNHGTKVKSPAANSAARLKQYADNWSDCSSGSDGEKEKGHSGGVGGAASGSSGCEGSSSTSDCEWDQDSCSSSETSSYNSECHDDEEIALAVQAAELASRNHARARFRSSSDMIHRLFVCVSGVADQLQTNFAGDLRNILRVVFNLNCSEPVVIEDEKTFRRHRQYGARSFYRRPDGGDGNVAPNNNSTPTSREPPTWIPDDQSAMCMSCKTPFTFVRRRHHCRNCGKIFCGRCSSNAVSLPHFGHSKPVRVCNRCFMFQVTPFTMQGQA